MASEYTLLRACRAKSLITVLFATQSYSLLNCDDHKNFLMKHKKDPALYRPDICHQVRAERCGDGSVWLDRRGVEAAVPCRAAVPPIAKTAVDYNA